MSIIDELKAEEFEFKIQRFGSVYALSRAIRIKPARIKVQFFKDKSFDHVKQLIDVATQEEELAEYPNNFFLRLSYWWQRFKKRWFSKWLWLYQRYPVTWNQVWAIHKFPELEVPDLGKECVHLKVVQYSEIQKLLERQIEES